MKTNFIHFLTIALLVLATQKATAQSFVLQGKVCDEDMSPIELASVTSQGKMVMTNLKGEFHITLASRDSVAVKFSMVGYKSKTRVLRHPKGKQTLQITLHSDNQLGEVVVTERKRQTTGTQQLDVKKTKGAPSTTGNAVEDMIQSQAGVSTHSELSSQYNVRGGAFDENLEYINNVEVYQPI